LLERHASKPFELSEREFELFWLAPIERGFAALGLTGKLNGPGAVRAASWQGASHAVELRDTGEFLAWSDEQPSAVISRERAQPLAFRYDATTHALSVGVSRAEDRAFTVVW
jgi:hypothetical protein